MFFVIYFTFLSFFFIEELITLLEALSSFSIFIIVDAYLVDKFLELVLAYRSTSGELLLELSRSSKILLD
jgi:hypothetical protein